jgi:hypothetical protein
VDAEGRKELVEELCSFEERGPGTDAERRAANMLAGRLRRMGRRAEIEPLHCHPNYALVHAVTVTAAIAGSLLATVQPAIGFALVLAAATSMYLDVNTRFYLARRLLFRRASQNVVSPGTRSEAPTRLILSAHYDAAPSGWVFGERGLAFIRRLPQRARILLGPFRLIFWGGMVPLLPILGARMAGFEPAWLDFAQLVPTVVLIISLFLLIDIALSQIVPGAYDNASGVATVLSAAEQLEREPPSNLDVWVVLTGSEESHCEGMRSFVKAHRDMDPATTLVVNVDQTGYGAVHYLVSEGALISYPMDEELVELCRALAASDPRYAAEPARTSLQTDALPALIRGRRAISLTGLVDGLPAGTYHTHDDIPENVDQEAMTRATDFTVALVRLIDRGAAREAAPAPAPPEPAAAP